MKKFFFSPFIIIISFLLIYVLSLYLIMIYEINLNNLDYGKIFSVLFLIITSIIIIIGIFALFESKNESIEK